MDIGGYWWIFKDVCRNKKSLDVGDFLRTSAAKSWFRNKKSLDIGGFLRTSAAKSCFRNKKSLIRGLTWFSWFWAGRKIVLESFSRFNAYEPFWRPARRSLFSWLGLAWSGLVDMGGYGGYGRIFVDF